MPTRAPRCATTERGVHSTATLGGGGSRTELPVRLGTECVLVVLACGDLGVARARSGGGAGAASRMRLVPWVGDRIDPLVAACTDGK